MGVLPAGHVAGQICDPLRDAPPGIVLFFWRDMGRCWDRVTLLHQRAQIYDLLMAVQEIDDHLRRDAGRQWGCVRDCCELHSAGLGNLDSVLSYATEHYLMTNVKGPQNAHSRRRYG